MGAAERMLRWWDDHSELVPESESVWCRRRPAVSCKCGAVDVMPSLFRTVLIGDMQHRRGGCGVTDPTGGDWFPAWAGWWQE